MTPPLHWISRSYFWAFAVALIAWAATGCDAPMIRRAVPEALQDQTTVAGFNSIRFWGDVSTPCLERIAQEMIAAERRFLRLPANATELPSADYLAVSGGGSDGAFGAGLLAGWASRGDFPRFQIITGLSTGSVLAILAFVAPTFDYKYHEMYTTVSTRDLLANRSLLALLSSDSLADNAMLKAFVKRHITDDMIRAVAEQHATGRRLLVGTTNLDAQRPVVWDMGAIAGVATPEAYDLFRQVILASSSIPAVFPPTFFSVTAEGSLYDEMHVDGGATAQVFLFPSSLDLRGMATSSGIRPRRRAFIIRNGRLAPEADAVPDRLGSIATRATSTLIKYHSIAELQGMYHNTQRNGIEFYLAYIPDDFTEKPLEEFDRVHMTKLFDRGFEMARKGFPWAQRPRGLEANSTDTTAPPQTAVQRLSGRAVSPPQ